MRLFLLPAAIAVPLLADPSAHAQSANAIGCVDHHFDFARDGMKSVEAHTRAGQPCQIGFGLRGANILALEIRVRPEHGVLGASDKEENRRFIAYAPHKGFVGRDRFEVFVRYTPPTSGYSYFTQIKFDMNVTP